MSSDRGPLGHKTPSALPIPDGWDGQWVLSRLKSDRITADLDHGGIDPLTLAEDGTLTALGIVLARGPQGLSLSRHDDNTQAVLISLPVMNSAGGEDIAGRYHLRFTGLLGTGRMERMAPAGSDVWTVATRRSIDAPSPGDWTLVVGHDDKRSISGLTLGCWLAREVAYQRVKPFQSC